VSPESGRQAALNSDAGRLAALNPEDSTGPGGAAEVGGGFSRRAVGWLAGVAGGSLLAALLLTAYGQDLGRPADPQPTSWSVSAIGHHALAELLRGLGVGVAVKQTHSLRLVMARSGGGRPEGLPALLLLEPDLGRLGGGRSPLGEQVTVARTNRVPLVLVLPKWSGTPDPARPGWVGELRLLAPAEVMRAIGALGLPELAGLELRRGTAGRVGSGVGGGGGLGCTGWPSGPAAAVELPEAQLLADRREALTPVVTCRGGLLAGARRLGADGPWLLVVSDPDLLDNQGLGRGANAEVAAALLTSWLGAGVAVFDETIHGYHHAPGLLAEALGFPLVLATAQAALAAALVVWAGSRRFGKPLPEAAALPPGKEALIDNTARLLTSGGHGDASLAHYFRQTTRAVSARFFLPPDLQASELTARLQQISDQRGLGVNLAAMERAVGRRSGRARRPRRNMERGCLAVAQGLHRWRRRMLEEG
jgi:hypothetical protein